MFRSLAPLKYCSPDELLGASCVQFVDEIESNPAPKSVDEIRESSEQEILDGFAGKFHDLHKLDCSTAGECSAFSFASSSCTQSLHMKGTLFESKPGLKEWLAEEVLSLCN